MYRSKREPSKNGLLANFNTLKNTKKLAITTTYLSKINRYQNRLNSCYTNMTKEVAYDFETHNQPHCCLIFTACHGLSLKN